MRETLYQKYRPQNFEEVVGQDFIVSVLKNSIKYENVQNTYLLSGPRGTGKTSLAKIFAKAMNCASLDNPLHDDCEYCEYFANNKEYDDIFELDAASNNGVDDVRRIIENCYFQPVKLHKKVYIIDEVHMLSKGAFNALLKTLENPPEHVVFILATTEPQKIPATILSRCQRLDLQRIAPEDMKAHLNNILQKEEVEITDDALDIIVQFSDGCLRDSLSLMQKVIINETFVDKKMMLEKLNLVDIEVNQQILQLIREHRTNELIKLWQKLYKSGINEELFIIELQNFLKKDLLENDYGIAEKYELIEIIQKVNDLEQRAVYTNNLNNLIEVALISLSLPALKNTPVSNPKMNIEQETGNFQKQNGDLNNSFNNNAFNNPTNNESINDEDLNNSLDNLFGSNGNPTNQNLTNQNSNKPTTSNFTNVDNFQNEFNKNDEPKSFTQQINLKNINKVNNMETIVEEELNIIQSNEEANQEINDLNTRVANEDFTNQDNFQDDNFQGIEELNSEIDSKITSEMNSETNLKANNFIKAEYTRTSYYRILETATKEDKIKNLKNFSKVSEELLMKKKNGLAKFFNEGNIKAANEKRLIVTIDEDLVVDFRAKEAEIVNHLDDMDTVMIVSEKEWLQIRTDFLGQLERKKESKAGQDNKQDGEAELIANTKRKIEDKLKVEVKIIEE